MVVIDNEIVKIANMEIPFYARWKCIMTSFQRIFIILVGKRTISLSQTNERISSKVLFTT